MKTHEIGKEKAIEMYESKWWKNQNSRQIAEFQMITDELCCPFSIFHKAIEDTLDRPVFTHEFGMNRDGLIQELFGERAAPTMQEIVEMIPESKRIVIMA